MNQKTSNRYSRDPKIEKQIQEFKDKSYSDLEYAVKYCKKRNDPEYVYTETLVAMYVHYRDMGKTKHAKAILMYITERAKPYLYTWCKRCNIQDMDECLDAVNNNLVEILYTYPQDKLEFWCCNFICALQRLFGKWHKNERNYQAHIVSFSSLCNNKDDEETPSIADLPDSRIDVTREALSSLELEYLLQNLNPNERLITRLLMQEYSQQEIASIFQCTERTVRNYIQRIREKLSDKIGR